MPSLPVGALSPLKNVGLLYIAVGRRSGGLAVADRQAGSERVSKVKRLFSIRERFVSDGLDERSSDNGT